MFAPFNSHTYLFLSPQASVDMLRDLRALQSEIEVKVGLLEQNLPVSKGLLNTALAHAKTLEEQASALQW